ncbi:hypothetical protein OROMI_013153 [Orobanche minor]
MVFNRITIMVPVAVVMLVAAIMVAGTTAQVTEKNVNLQCMTECYFDCTQIKIFSASECKRECAVACARYFMRKAVEEEDDNKFVPLWI